MQPTPIIHPFLNTFDHPFFNKEGTIARGNNREWFEEGYQDYKRFKQMVLERDHYTCQKCGKSYKTKRIANGQYKPNMRVCHILPYALYPERRIDPTNAITLCCDCDEELSHEFGTMIDNRQVEVFLHGGSK